MTTTATELTVMTYNIRNGHPDAGHEWAERAPLVAEVIRRAEPDLLGAQEVLAPQLADLIAALPEYEHAGISRDGAGEDEYGPVVWRRDRFDAVETGQFWLSDTPDVPGSNTWGALCTRCVTWARLRRRADGDELVFAATHLDHEETAHGDAVRERSARMLGARLTAPGAPVVLVGDFNTTPASAAYAALAETGLRQDASAAGPDAESSFHDYGRAEHPERIDWILHTDAVRTLRLEVDAAAPATAASDHYPVIARLELHPDRGSRLAPWRHGAGGTTSRPRPAG